PTLTATTRSRIPSRFQTTKTRLVAKPGRRTRARATHGAVTPMAMSPRPAGQAKAPGSTPWAYRARNPSPPARPARIAAARAGAARGRGREGEVEGHDIRREGGQAPGRTKNRNTGGRRREEDGTRGRPGRPGDRPGGPEKENRREPEGERACDDRFHGSTR